MFETFGLDKHLMALLVGKAHDLVFYGWAIARAGRLDLPRIHRRTMEIRANQFVGRGAGIGQVTKDLRQRDAIGENRERSRHVVAGRRLELREIDGILRDARRRSCLQPAQSQAEAAERIGKRLGRRLAESPSDGLRFSGVHQRAEKSAGGDDDGARAKLGAVCKRDASRREPRNGSLNDGEVRFAGEDVVYGPGVKLAIALRARSLHRRTLRSIEDLVLNGGAIGGLAHQPAEGVDFFDEVAFRETADGRIARHAADRGALHGDHRHARPAPGAHPGGLGPRVAASDHDDIEVARHGSTWNKRTAGVILTPSGARGKNPVHALRSFAAR